MKLSQLGEFALIERFSKLIGKSFKPVIIGIGDDAAALEIQNAKSKRLLLITTDTLVENIHFDLKTTSFFDLGYKALTINISDIAAMGGNPTYAVVTIGANKNLFVKKIEQLYRGIRKAAKKYKVQIVGGDTVQSRDLVISITLLGEVEREYLLTRSGAKLGDLILVTGTFGRQAASHYALRASHYPIRLKEARLIAKAKLANSMIDSSDGLVRSIREICKASKVSAKIDFKAIPIAKGASLNQALFGGEEYELVFTASKAKAAKLIKLIPNLSIVGKIVKKGKGNLPKGGFEHFK